MGNNENNEFLREPMEHKEHIEEHEKEEEITTTIVRVYYDKDSGYLCDRYPTDIPHDENTTPYIELDTAIDEQNQLYESTFSVASGKVWAVKNGKLQIIDNIEEQNSNEYKVNQINSQITILKNNLASTDYLAIKYSEGELSEEEFKPTRQQRKSWRVEINRLEKEIDDYGN